MHATIEVKHVSSQGLWLRLGDEELMLPYKYFPWFRKATIDQLTDVEWPSPNHVYWPQLDIDLSAESIRNPAAFLLIAKEQN